MVWLKRIIGKILNNRWEGIIYQGLYIDLIKQLSVSVCCKKAVNFGNNVLYICVLMSTLLHLEDHGLLLKRLSSSRSRGHITDYRNLCTCAEG